MSTLQKYAESSNADLRAEAIMDTLQKKILKKPKVKEQDLPTIIPTRKLEQKPSYNTNQYLADKDRNDMAFEIKLKTISDNATKKVSDNKSEPVSNITKAMIEDYQAEQQQPLIVGDKAFKYHPIDSVDLEKPNLKPILSDEELEDLSDEYASLIDEYTQTTNEIANLRKDLKVEDENINDRMARAKTRIQKSKIEQDYLTEASRIKKEINFQMRYLAGIEADLESAQVRLNLNTDNIKNNEDEIVRTDQVNKVKLSDLTNRFTNLNKDRNLVIEQREGESNEDYLNRLVAEGETTYGPEETIELAKLKNIGTTKQNLKEFFSDEGKVTTIAKMLPYEEKYVFNKMFPKIKKKYLEVYGFDNKLVSNSDVVDFINQFRLSTEPAAESVKASEPVSALEAPEPVVATPIKGRKEKKISDFFPAVPPPSVSPKAAGAEDEDENLRPEAEWRKKYPGTPHDELKQWAIDNRYPLKGRSNAEMMLSLNRAGVRIPDYFIHNFKNKGDRDMGNHLNFSLGISDEPTQEAPLTGFGVHVKQYPKIMKFGKVYVTADQLYYNNLLGIRNKNNRQVTGIPNVIVSDSLVHLIFKILDGGSVTKSDLSILKPNEKTVYDKLMKLSGLHKSMVNSVDETLSDMKKRLELISGEIEAGNNNKELLKEAHGILHSMAQMKVITHVEASKYYKDLKSFF
jgi:hypothetical protein